MIFDIFADMKRLFILFLALFICLTAFCNTDDKDNDKQKRVLVALATIIDGDTVPTFQLMEVTIYGRREYPPSARKQRKYDKLTRNVVKMYPIACELKAILVETYLYLQGLPDDKEREKHLETVEKGLWEQYMPVMKKCTLAQGKLLIKLVDRETGSTTYQVIQELKGGFSAFIWQVVARLFGSNLKSEYDADEEDRMIEDIIIRIENGLL